jgi:hypothetical protein
MNQNQTDFKTEFFWKNISKKESDLKYFPSFESDPTMKREYARLSDLRFFQSENKHPFFRDITQQMSFYGEDLHQSRFKTQLHIGNKEPSSLPLLNPFF